MSLRLLEDHRDHEQGHGQDRRAHNDGHCVVPLLEFFHLVDAWGHPVEDAHRYGHGDGEADRGHNDPDEQEDHILQNPAVIWGAGRNAEGQLLGQPNCEHHRKSSLLGFSAHTSCYLRTTASTSSDMARTVEAMTIATAVFPLRSSAISSTPGVIRLN